MEDKKYVDVSVPKYVKEALICLQHKSPPNAQYSPQHHNPINYSSKGKQQSATQLDFSPLLHLKETRWVQSVVGTFLYYCRAIDCTLSIALNNIALSQANPTVNTKKKCIRLMNYVSTYPDAYIRFHASEMVLFADSDAAFLVLPKAKSRVAGFFSFE